MNARRRRNVAPPDRPQIPPSPRPTIRLSRLPAYSPHASSSTLSSPHSFFLIPCRLPVVAASIITLLTLLRGSTSATTPPTCFSSSRKIAANPRSLLPIVHNYLRQTIHLGDNYGRCSYHTYPKHMALLPHPRTPTSSPGAIPGPHSPRLSTLSIPFETRSCRRRIMPA